MAGVDNTSWTGVATASRPMGGLPLVRGAGRTGGSPVLQRMASPLLRMLDQISLTLALVLTILSYYLRQQDASMAGFLGLRVSMRNLLIELGFLLTWRFLFWLSGIYSRRLVMGVGALMWRVPMAVGMAAALLAPALMLHHNDRDLGWSCILFWLTGTTLMLTSRAALFTYDEHVRPLMRRRRSVIICGTGLRARALALELAGHQDYRYHLLGFIDSHPQSACDRVAPLLGSVAEMEALLMRLPVDEVMVALPVKSHFGMIEDIVGICGRAGVQTQYSLDIFSTDVAKHRIVDISEGNRVVLQMVNQDHRLVLKGFVDRLLSAVGLFLISPVLIGIAIAIKLTSDGPVFFVQQRFGLNKRMFGMVKFRSMVVGAEAKQAELEHLNEAGGPTFKMRTDPRVTKVGAFLRRSSMDELPQLFNVLRGEMSLVGPRPLPARDVDRFSEAWLMRRFSVKPGITGLWQVSGRSNTDFDQAIKLDLRYIDKWSLAMDFKILARTISAVVRGSGAY